MAGEAAGAGHDASWRQAYAYFFRHRFQAGVDYAFTLGPYGYFFSPQYDADLYWLNFFVQAALAIVLCVSVVTLAMRARTLLECAGLYGLALFVLPVSGRSSVLFVAIVTMTAVVLKPFRGRWAVLVACELVMAFIGLIKFGHFIVATMCVAALSIAVGSQGRWWHAGAAVLTYTSFVGALWLAAGQHPAHFIPYILSSLEIGAAYNQTMMLAGPNREIVLAGITSALLVPALVLSVWRRDRPLEACVGPALFLVLLVLLWKGSFVRQPGHTTQFFAYAALVSLVVDWRAARPASLRRIASSLCVAAFTVAIVSNVTSSRLRSLAVKEIPLELSVLAIENSAKLLRPIRERVRLEAHRKQLRRVHDLPLIRDAIGGGRVDMLAHRQGELFLNGLNYHPRPVFQGYQAGTAKLSRRNADFYSGPDAPEFVMAWITPIDGRYPATEDAETLKAVLWHYTPILKDEPYILLRRAPGIARPLQPEVIRPTIRRRVEWGEWMETGADRDTWQLLSLTIEPSLLGRARAIVYRPPFLYLETRMSDGGLSRWRVHRGMIETGFILNPFLLHGTELLAAYQGAPERWVDSFRVLNGPGGERLFDSDIRVELQTIAPLTAHHLQPVQ